MLYYDRIELSERIDLTKSNNRYTMTLYKMVRLVDARNEKKGIELFLIDEK